MPRHVACGSEAAVCTDRVRQTTIFDERADPPILAGWPVEVGSLDRKLTHYPGGLRVSGFEADMLTFCVYEKAHRRAVEWPRIEF
jgi:hypothetical protein